MAGVVAYQSHDGVAAGRDGLVEVGPIAGALEPVPENEAQVGQHHATIHVTGRAGRHRGPSGVDRLLQVGLVSGALKPRMQNMAEVGQPFAAAWVPHRSGGDGGATRLDSLVEFGLAAGALEPRLQRDTQVVQRRGAARIAGRKPADRVAAGRDGLVQVGLAAIALVPGRSAILSVPSTVAFPGFPGGAAATAARPTLIASSRSAWLPPRSTQVRSTMRLCVSAGIHMRLGVEKIAVKSGGVAVFGFLAVVRRGVSCPAGRGASLLRPGVERGMRRRGKRKTFGSLRGSGDLETGV